MLAFLDYKGALWLFGLSSVAVALLLVAPAEALYVLTPTFVALWLCGYCVARVWRNDREVPILDIGVFAVTFTTLYTVVPLINFYFGGMEFGLLSDGRLRRHDPTAIELGLFFRHHIAYLASLTLAYLFFRSNTRLPLQASVSAPRPLTVNVLVLFFLFLSIYFVFLLYVFGIGFWSGYGDESHIIEGPLWLQQLNGKLSGIYFVIQAALLAFLILRKDDVRARYCLFLLIAWNISAAFIHPGSRGELMWLILLSFLFWHRFHGTRRGFALVFFPVVLCAFLFLGLLRSFLDLGDFVQALVSFETLASASNEFQSVLGTGFDVYKMKEEGVVVPSVLLLNDLVPLFPPQQLLPFQKLSGADWYLIQIGHDGTGVGFMWSVISQSLVGLGLIELIVRGVALGWFLAHVHRWYRRRYTKFVPNVLYAVLCVTTLWTFRDTTGAILWTIWWMLIPFAFLLLLLGLGSELSRTFLNRKTIGSTVRGRFQT